MTIQEQLQQAAIALKRAEQLATELSGIDEVVSKLQSMTAGKPTEPLTPKEAAYLSWSLGATVHLTIAAKEQRKEDEQQPTEPVKRWPQNRQ